MIDVEQALSMLAVHDGEASVHSFRGTLGADWPLDAVRALIEEHGAELAPEDSTAVALGHALIVRDDVGVIAFATKGDVKGRRTALDVYEQGWLACLGTFAYTTSERWAESGVQYVGTTGCTRRDAAVEFLTERGFEPETARELAG